MRKTLLSFLFCTLLAAPALANTVSIDESGPEGTLPIVTLANDLGSSFLERSMVTAITCPNQAVLTECWNIDVIVQGTNISTFGTPKGLELSEPGTPGILSDSFGAVSANPFSLVETDIRFQLFSDDPSGTLGARAFVCQQGSCLQAVEDGTFQAANVGVTVFNNPPFPQTPTSQSFDVFLKSDVGDAPVDVNAVPEPSSLLLLGTGLLGVGGIVRRKLLS